MSCLVGFPSTLHLIQSACSTAIGMDDKKDVNDKSDLYYLQYTILSVYDIYEVEPRNVLSV